MLFRSLGFAAPVRALAAAWVSSTPRSSREAAIRSVGSSRRGDGPPRRRDAAQQVQFQVQGAWTRRGLGSVEATMGDEVRRTLQPHVEELRRCGEVKRLENVAVREAQIVEASQDQGQDTVRVLASPLDDTTDEASRLRERRDREPEKFEEC